MIVKKTKLKAKNKIIPTSININIPITNLKRYFTIRNGILYQYERKTARVMMDRYKIRQIGAMSLKTEDN